MKTFEGYQRGVNMGGWLSQCDYSEERLNGFILEEDFAVVKSWGLDHVRIPFDYNIVQNEEGTLIEAGFEHLDRAVGWAQKYGLNIILDLHKTIGYSFGSDYGGKCAFFEDPQLQECFYTLWSEVARRYGEYSEFVAFELLNEITDQEYSEKWYRIAENCVKRIREYAPDTWVLLGGYGYNSVEAVSDLPAPWDSKIVYNFHCYKPHPYTHQKARWDRNIDQTKNWKYEEMGVDTAYFEEYFRKACEAAEKNSTTLYCGEYGVIDQAEPEDALNWFKDIHAAFKKLGIGRSVWTYRQMDFGISDARMDAVRDELLKYL